MVIDLLVQQSNNRPDRRSTRALKGGRGAGLMHPVHRDSFCLPLRPCVILKTLVGEAAAGQAE